MRTGTPEELAYCAGVMDSDGHIGIHRNTYRIRVTGDAKHPSYQPRCSVKQVDEGAIALFHDLFAGHRYLDSHNNRGSCRPIHIWQVHSRATRPVLEALRPYLRIKMRQADLARELCDINAGPRMRGYEIPAVIPGEPLVALADAAALLGKSYRVASQAVSNGTLPVVRKGRSVFVPESYLETWRTRSRAPQRRPEVTQRMAEIQDAIKALNSGARGQHFPSPPARS